MKRLGQLLFELAVIAAMVAAVIGGVAAMRSGGVSALPSGIRYVPSSSVRVWLDPETGCEYFAEAWTPRLTRDGRPLCSIEGESHGEGHEP